VRRFAGLGSYLTINISSPNTPGLRALQGRGELAELLGRATAARASLAEAAGTPIFLKIAPDLVEDELADIAAEVAAHGIEGVIVSNTTLSRAGVAGSAHGGEAGGLSGRPLFERSTAVLARMRRLLGPDVALIGVGGVGSAEAALEKIRAGADLVQLYTGLISGGPSLPGRILRDMIRALEAERLDGLAALRGTRTGHWAGKAI
jgi:dihydroorotate dehydrogenase